ncbi:MAG TPA: hypothetical protein VJJ73_02710 [Candidatus Paceibacterota bacterium]
MSNFTEEEDQELARLLTKVAENEYHFPSQSYHVLEGVVSRWAPELVIIRGKEILLAVYDGGIKEFQGMWHIPGGRDYWPAPDMQANCSLVSTREIGVDVEFIKVLDIYKWKTGEHPDGHPLSIYVECWLRGEVIETETLRFFSINNLPPVIVGVHERWIKSFFSR